MCCASTRVDDANQWRLYGAEGRGYAVELNPLVNLRAVVSGDRPPIMVDSYEDAEGRAHSFVLPSDTVDVSPWLHVLYADEEKSEALAGLVDGASAELVSVAALGARAGSDDGEYYRAHEDLLTIVGQDLARLAQLMKSPGFAGEDEVRVLAVDHRPEEDSTRAARFRSTPFGVARYVRLSASTTVVDDDTEPYIDPSATLYDDEERQLPMTAVRLGPRIRADNNQSTVRALLASAGYLGCAVEASGIPLR
jgi:hypothetical protein